MTHVKHPLSFHPCSSLCKDYFVCFLLFQCNIWWRCLSFRLTNTTPISSHTKNMRMLTPFLFSRSHTCKMFQDHFFFCCRWSVLGSIKWFFFAANKHLFGPWSSSPRPPHPGGVRGGWLVERGDWGGWGSRTWGLMYMGVFIQNMPRFHSQTNPTRAPATLVYAGSFISSPITGPLFPLCCWMAFKTLIIAAVTSEWRACESGDQLVFFFSPHVWH